MEKDGMNPLIERLAREAGFSVDPPEFEGDGWASVDGQDCTDEVSRLIALVAQECARRIDAAAGTVANVGAESDRMIEVRIAAATARFLVDVMAPNIRAAFPMPKG
jgi:hypothetical protein